MVHMPDFSFEDHCCASNEARPQLILLSDKSFVSGPYNLKVEERTSARHPVGGRLTLLIYALEA